MRRAQQLGNPADWLLRAQHNRALPQGQKLWQTTYVLNKQSLPQSPPRLNEAIRLIARLGGFLGRKGDGEPGVKTIWQGLMRVMDFAEGFKQAQAQQEP